MRIKLKDAFELQIGKTPSRNKSEYWNGVYKWVSVSDIGNSEKYVYSTRELITDKGIIDSGIKVIPKGTVIMSFKLSIGKTAITTEDMYTNEAIVAFIDKKKISIDIDYLYYLCSGSNWMQGVNKAVMGLTLNKATLSEKEINIPNIEIQKKCAGNLDKIDRIIDLKKQQLDQLDLLVRSLFIEMFGDPSMNPKGYPEKSLSEITEYWNGLIYKPEDVSNEGTIVLRSSNIRNATLDFEDIVRVSCKIGDKKYVQDNDILMCSRNGSARLVGKVALIKDIDEPMSFGAFMIIIRSPYYQYLMTYFQMPAFRAQITTGATTTINQITVRMLDSVKLPVPELDFINEFSDFIKPIDKSKYSSFSHLSA